MVLNLNFTKQKSSFKGPSIVLLTLLICLLPLLIGLAHDIERTYTTTPDADLIYLGQVLRLADGLSQTYFDHTGHSYILVLFCWLKFLSIFGLIPKLSELTAITVSDIDAYFQSLVIAGRCFSIVMGGFFTILVIIYLLSLPISPIFYYRLRKKAEQLQAKKN